MSAKSISFNHSNLAIVAKGKDANGNSTIKLMLPKLAKAFSIHTNGSLPLTHNLLKSMKFNSFKEIQSLNTEQLDVIEKEVIDYIIPYGTKKQNESLKIYK